MTRNFEPSLGQICWVLSITCYHASLILPPLAIRINKLERYVTPACPTTWLCMAPHHILNSRNSIQHYQPHTGTAVLLHWHLSIYPYRRDIHAQQRMNAHISPVLHAEWCAEPFLMRAEPKAIEAFAYSNKVVCHTKLRQKFWSKLVHFRKYLFENCIDWKIRNFIATKITCYTV